MAHIMLFEDFETNEGSDNANVNWFHKLYNGIMNDYSIRRNTMQWKDVTDQLDRKYKNKIPKTDDTFEDDILVNAIAAASEDKKLLGFLTVFAKELDISVETMRTKTAPHLSKM